MFRRFYTVMIVPHEGGTLRRLSVSMNFVVSMAGIFLFCFVSSAFLAHFFIGGMHRPDRSEILRAELERVSLDNAQLRSEVQGLWIKADQLAERIEDYKRVKSSDPRAETTAMGGGIPAELTGDPLALEGEWRGVSQSVSEKIDYLRNWLDEEICEEETQQSCIPHGWPVIGRVTSGCGWRRDPINGNRQQYHEGLDIAAPHGSPVRTTGDGVVIECGRRGGYGNMVRIEHGPNAEGKDIQTIYGHLRRIHVKEGDLVKKGATIGEVGSTGRSTGQHLHFEVLENGMPINPVRKGYVP